MIRIVLTTAFFLFAGFLLRAQDTLSESEESEYTLSDSVYYYEEADTIISKTQSFGEPVAHRKFEQESWKKITDNKNYDEKKPEEEEKKEDEKEKEKANEKSKENSDFSIPPMLVPIFKVIAYLGVIALVVFILFKLLREPMGKPTVKLTKPSDDAVSEEVENIEELDTQSLLKKALAEGNFKLAIRLYYLDLLKKLNETGVIHWKKDKTNRDYLSEIFQRDYFYNDIRSLTLAYEVVWYGEHAMTRESLQAIIRDFETINQQINTGR